MTESSYSKIAVLYSVVAVVSMCFTGGVVTYGYLADTQQTSMSVEAAGNFPDSTTTNDVDDAAGNTSTCAGNTGCDSALELRFAPVQSSAAAPSRDASRHAETASGFPQTVQ